MAQQINTTTPPKCEVCGAFKTASPEYAGRRCTCSDGPLTLAYLALCAGCEHIAGLDCQPERCARKIGEAT